MYSCANLGAGHLEVPKSLDYDMCVHSHGTRKVLYHYLLNDQHYPQKNIMQKCCCKHDTCWNTLLTLCHKNLSIHIISEEARAIEAVGLFPCHNISNIPLDLYLHAPRKFSIPYLYHAEATCFFLSSKIKNCITFHCSVRAIVCAPSITICACSMNKVIIRNESKPE